MAWRTLQVAGAVLMATGLPACLHRAASAAPGSKGAAPAAAPAMATAPEKTASSQATPAPAPAPSPTADDPFIARVRPILERRCSPCHFSGGIMYGRLPFDNPDAVRSKPEPLLRRLKVAEEHEAVAAWLRAPSP